jgi:hypothetical protein
MRWRIISRLVLPTLLVSGGIAAVIYGAKFHAAEVFEQIQVEKTIKIPVPFSPSEHITGSSPWGEGPAAKRPLWEEGPASPDNPGFITQTITRTIEVPKLELEPTLMREMTVSGVRLDLESGKLIQTYSGRPPSLCPT